MIKNRAIVISYPIDVISILLNLHTICLHLKPNSAHFKILAKGFTIDYPSVPISYASPINYGPNSICSNGPQQPCTQQVLHVFNTGICGSNCKTTQSPFGFYSHTLPLAAAFSSSCHECVQLSLTYETNTCAH